MAHCHCSLGVVRVEQIYIYAYRIATGACWLWRKSANDAISRHTCIYIYVGRHTSSSLSTLFATNVFSSVFIIIIIIINIESNSLVICASAWWQWLLAVAVVVVVAVIIVALHSIIIVIHYLIRHIFNCTNLIIIIFLSLSISVSFVRCACVVVV